MCNRHDLVDDEMLFASKVYLSSCLDTGDMLLVERQAIRPDDSTGTLHDRLAALGGRLIVEALELAACGGLSATPQPAEGVNYAHKIEKAEALLDWSLDASTLARRVRAFNPFPGAVTSWQGESLKVWAAVAEGDQSASAECPAGSVRSAAADGVRVQTRVGLLCLTELQRAGGKRLPVADFLRGVELLAGARLGSLPA